MKHQTLLILDFGSQYTQLIARRVRELGVYSVVRGAHISVEQIKALNPQAIVFSGGPSSVYEKGAPTLPEGFLAFQESSRVPVLGICYGLQLLVQGLGGAVRPGKVKEYGRARIQIQGLKAGKSVLAEFANESKGSASSGPEVWMSHGDEVEKIPLGFEVSALSQSGVIAAIENPSRALFGIQFHPEVTHTPKGIEILKSFVFGVSKFTADWSRRSIREEQVEKIRKLAGSTDRAICALSGGVDSAVAATLVHEALGDRLICVFVDHGLLRYQESESTMKLFTEKLHLPVIRVDASDLFLGALKGVTDPETKRKIIGAKFIEVFRAESEKLKDATGAKPRFLVQGTLYPDVIESSPVGSMAGPSTVIKSHHNVGGLPKDLGFELIEPLRDLFKDEVRALGRELGVSPDFLNKHPFPGPGLAVRILGEITRERIETLQQVDHVFLSCIREAGLYEKIWQAFAVFLPIRSVGVQGDGRTHHHVVGLRAVTSHDGMTADWYPFDHAFLAHVSNEISNRVRGVGRVVYDISSKPPATIEWE